MSLFKNKGALNLDRLSVEVVGRAQEAERLKNILKGIEQGYLPKVMSIFGPLGSGKTFIVRRICGEFEGASSGLFKFVYINLGEMKTIFSAANRLNMALGGTQTRTRRGLDGVMEEFWNRTIGLADKGMKFMLIALDEVDKLFFDKRSNPSGFMYRLVRSEDRLGDSGVCLSLLTISNTILWDHWEMDGRVRSSMSTEEILFSPYSEEEIKHILVNRCEEAFQTDVVSDEFIDDCAKRAINRTKDIRRLIDLLRISGDVAEANGDKRLEIKHLEQALDQIEASHIEALLTRLAVPQTFLLIALASAKEKGNMDLVHTSVIYQLYQELIGDEHTLSYRRISGLLKELEVMGLIDSRTVSRGRYGSGNEIWLKIPAKPVLDFAREKWNMAI